MHWQIRHGTSNAKLGPGAWVVTLDRSTCPPSCPLKGAGCYAESVPLRIAWDRVSRGDAKHDGITRWAGHGLDYLADTLESLPIPSNATLRIGDAGDPAPHGKLHARLIESCIHLHLRGVQVILYTHAPMTPANLTIAEDAGKWGLAVNFSTHSTAAAARARHTVVVVPRDYWGSDRDDGAVTRCPAEVSPTTCEACGLCADARRIRPVGFTAHGSRAAAVEASCR